MNIILAGGVNESKYKKIAADLIDSLHEKGVIAETSYVNTYEHQDLSAFEHKMDLIVVLGTNQVKSALPVVGGMGLIYPWLGKEQVIEEIIRNKK